MAETGAEDRGKEEILKEAEAVEAGDLAEAETDSAEIPEVEEDLQDFQAEEDLEDKNNFFKLYFLSFTMPTSHTEIQ